MVQIMWQTLTMVGSVLLYSTEQHRVLSKRSRSGRNDEVQWSQLLLDTVQRAYDEGLKIEVDELRKEISGLQKENDLSKRMNENINHDIEALVERIEAAAQRFHNTNKLQADELHPLSSTSQSNRESQKKLLR